MPRLKNRLRKSTIVLSLSLYICILILISIGFKVKLLLMPVHNLSYLYYMKSNSTLTKNNSYRLKFASIR